LPKRRRSILSHREADKIASKLNAEIKHGTDHDIAIVRVNGVEVGRFGIRRAMNVGHDYLPRQIGTNMKNALGLARCSENRPEYEAALKSKSLYPAPPVPTTAAKT
jgi:hypothetical protein